MASFCVERLEPFGLEASGWSPQRSLAFLALVFSLRQPTVLLVEAGFAPSDMVVFLELKEVDRIFLLLFSFLFFSKVLIFL